MILQIVAGVLASYATCSLVLLFFPSIIHKKKQPVFVCQHISHRGGKSARQPAGWLWHQTEAVCQEFQLIQFRAIPHSGTLGPPNLSAFRNGSSKHVQFHVVWWKTSRPSLKTKRLLVVLCACFFSRAEPGLFKCAFNFLPQPINVFYYLFTPDSLRTNLQVPF